MYPLTRLVTLMNKHDVETRYQIFSVKVKLSGLKLHLNLSLDLFIILQLD